MASRYWVSPNTIVKFSVAAEEGFSNGLFFKPDGTKMYVVGQNGVDVNEYDLSAAWSINTASYLQNFSVSAQDTAPHALFFKDDGSKMYVLGQNGVDVNEYNLSTAWNISTASYLQNFSVSAQETLPTGLFFKADGTKMYVLGASGDDVNEYDLSTAWDISTASYLQNFSVAVQETNPNGLFFKPDGSKMYVVGSVGDDVNEYDLSTAWDISTAVYLQVFSVSGQETSPSGLFFKPDGTKMFIVGTSADSVFAYPLSTPWNISTITIDTWDGTAGTKWALTSGGAGGEAVPTTADDVYFDANSAGIVTIATGNTGAKSIDCTGFTGTIAGTVAITVGGGITISSGMTYSYTGSITITGTGTLISAGNTLNNIFRIDGTSIVVTLGDALNIASRTLNVLAGTFDTAGYTFTGGTLFSSNAINRSVILNSSTLTLSQTTAIDFLTSTNLTFNAGTSQITLSGTSASIAGGSQTFYNVTFTSASAGTRNITGANTFNNLTLNASATGLSQLSIADNQTVNGTLTCAGTSAIQRGFVRSNTIGTSRTITAAAVSATDCDFRDITIAGAAAPISPTRGCDCGGNSGITFPAAKNSYRVGTNNSWSGASSWALTSGGTGSNDNFPLAQDTAIINEDTTYTGTLSLSQQFNIGTFDTSNRTTAITFNSTTGSFIYGSCIIGSGLTISGAGTFTFLGRGTQTFTSAGKTITFPITVEKPTGAFELGDAYSSSNTITHNLGTFDAVTYNLTCATFASTNSNVRTINMGSGLWTLSGTNIVWTTATTTNLTLNKDTANILLTNTSTSARTFAGGVGVLYNKLTIGGATGTSIFTLINGTFTELASTKTVAHTVRFSASSAVVIDTWSVTGTAGNLVTVDSNSAGTRRTFTLTNSTAGLIDYLSVKDIGVASPNRFFVGDNSIDGGNNLNVIFASFPALDSSSMFFMFD